MKLLIITNNPNRASFRQRIGSYLKLLKENDINGDVEILPSGMIQRRKLFKKARAYDGVFLHKKGLNFIDAHELRAYSRCIIYNYDDAVMLSDRHPEKYSRSHFIPFRRSVSISDGVIVGSEHLAEYARPYNGNVTILPIGLDIGQYGCADSVKSDQMIRLVWIGSDSTIRYLEHIRAALDTIGRHHKNVMLRVIADKESFRCETMPVEMKAWNLQCRRLDLAECDIGLAPLPANPFTRGKCSFKVLEYSASGLPVVASPVGTNSAYIINGQTGYLAEKTEQWVEKISFLIQNPKMRAQLGQAGKLNAQQYDTSAIGQRLCAIIRRYIG